MRRRSNDYFDSSDDDAQHQKRKRPCATCTTPELQKSAPDPDRLRTGGWALDADDDLQDGSTSHLPHNHRYPDDMYYDRFRRLQEEEGLQDDASPHMVSETPPPPHFEEDCDGGGVDYGFNDSLDDYHIPRVGESGQKQYNGTSSRRVPAAVDDEEEEEFASPAIRAGTLVSSSSPRKVLFGGRASMPYVVERTTMVMPEDGLVRPTDPSHNQHQDPVMADMMAHNSSRMSMSTTRTMGCSVPPPRHRSVTASTDDAQQPRIMTWSSPPPTTKQSFTAGRSSNLGDAGSVSATRMGIGAVSVNPFSLSKSQQGTGQRPHADNSLAPFSTCNVEGGPQCSRQLFPTNNTAAQPQQWPQHPQPHHQQQQQEQPAFQSWSTDAQRWQQEQASFFSRLDKRDLNVVEH